MTIYRDQLEAVYKLIEDEKQWTKGAFARNDRQEAIDDDYDVNEEGESLRDNECATHPDARCWCLYGAAYKAGIDNDLGFAIALDLTIPMSVVDFNDKHSHGEVLERLKNAIDRAPVRP